LRRYSLRRRLLTLLLASVVVAWAATTLLTYNHAHHELDELLDAHLARSARLLLAQEGDELEEIRVGDSADAGPYGQEVVLQVWRDGRVLALRSAGAPAGRLSPVESGFSDATVDGRHWRVFSGWDVERQVLVQVAEDHALRERLLAHYTLSGLPALLFGVPLLGVLVWLVVGAAVRPLAHLGHEVSRRGPGDLRPLPDDGIPMEVTPLVDRLNALFERISASMQAERRFTSHAAHELRTPIAAIRAQAEVARDGIDSAAREVALAHVIEGCDRAARLLNQMLLLARIDERASQDGPATSRLDQAAARVIADLAPAALDAGVAIELVSDEAVSVVADGALLEVLLRNLIDNAVRHGGPPGPVTVRCTQGPDGARLEVADCGAGVDDGELAQLGRRFYRASSAHGPGSGLGLSIVHRIAEGCGGTVRYRRGSDGRGFVVEVRLPPSSGG
jgi:two-component system, OmpR family, sensor histidine kinase QseC